LNPVLLAEDKMPKKITKTADRSPSPAGAGAPAEAFAPAPEDFAVVVAFGYLYSLYGASALAKVQAIASGLNTPAEEGGAEYVLGLEEGLWLSAVLSYGMQLVNYTLSRFAIADNFTGLVEFLPAAVIMYTRLSSPHPRQTLLTYMLGAWSLRLGLFLAYRLVARSGPDSRMDALRNQRGVLKAGLLSFWLIHGTWGFVVSLPVTLGNALGHASAQPLGDLDWLGLAVFAVGFCMEAVADQAKLTSYVNGDKARYYDQGGHPLWRFTRHPNFGGEILCWLGVAIVGSSVSLPPAGSVCACGAEGMLLRWGSLGLTVVLMLGEAGLLAERKNNHRFGSDPAFLRYRQSTSFIVPCPPAIYAGEGNPPAALWLCLDSNRLGSL
jgi:steroid 5-alpha reductase family enzyme